MKKMIVLLAFGALAAASVSHAKIPPPTPEAKAAADAKKSKTEWTEKVAAYQLCQTQDRIAARYFKMHPDAKKPTAEVPPCTNPGPYVEAGATAIGQVGTADSKPVPEAGKPPAPAAK